MTDSILLNAYIGFVACIIGLCMGSFLNCAAIRMINGESIVKGRSHCGTCNHSLGPLDLVPVFSWVFLKGRCRYCGERISARYPLSELFSAAVFLSAVLKFGLTIETCEMLILASLLLCISFTDIEGFIIPDGLIIAGIVCRIVFIIFSGSMLSELGASLIGGLSISLPLLIVVILAEKLLGKESMGGGDIKLLFMAGIYFHWSVNILGFIIACIIGIIAGVIYLRFNDSEDGHIPFGPSIAAGVWLAALFGDEIISWYMGIFS